MSYAFGMFFKEISKNDVFTFVNKVCEELADNSEEHIKSSVCYIPSLRTKDATDLVDKYWLNTLFELSFVYWPDKQLLGLCGYNYPDKVKTLFPSLVYFQNSTDHDYDFGEWPQYDLFQKHVFESCCASKSVLIKKYMEVNNCDRKEAEEFYAENTDYFKKALVYDAVYKELALDDWLWGNDNSSFIRLTVQAIDNDKKKFKAQIQLTNIKKNFLEECQKENHVANKNDKSNDEVDFDLE